MQHELAVGAEVLLVGGAERGDQLHHEAVVALGARAGHLAIEQVQHHAADVDHLDIKQRRRHGRVDEGVQGREEALLERRHVLRRRGVHREEDAQALAQHVVLSGRRREEQHQQLLEDLALRRHGVGEQQLSEALDCDRADLAVVVRQAAAHLVHQRLERHCFVG